MYRHKTTPAAQIALCLLCLLLLCVPASAQRRGRGARKPTPKPSGPVYVARSLDSPTDGDVAGQTYTNKYFGMKINFPEGWFVFNDVGKQDVKEGTKTLLDPKNDLEKRAVERSLERTFNLLVVRQSLDPAAQKGANLLVYAELLPVMNITTAQYAQLAKNTLLSEVSLKIETEGEVTSERLAGEEAAKLNLKVAMPDGTTVRQEFHTVIRRGWALGFVLSYVDEKQHALLTESLQSLAFEKPTK